MTATKRQRRPKPAPTPKKPAATKRSPASKKKATATRSSANKKTAQTKTAQKKTAQGSSAKKSAASTRAAAKKGTTRKRPTAIGTRANIGARNLTARTAEVRAARRQRSKSVVVVLIALSIATALGIGFTRSPMMAIDDVIVVGSDVVSEAEVVDAAAVEIGSPLLDLPTDVIEERVEAIPAIREASVTRNLVGQVTIDVTEREPIMALSAVDGFVLVDLDGRQVRTTPLAPDGFLPVIGLQATGVPGDPAPPGSTSVLRLMNEITPPVRAAVSEVIVTGDQMALRLLNGGRAVLGDERELEAKLITLETMLLSVDLRCVHEVDLTVPSAPAVSRIGKNSNPRDGLADLTVCS